MKALRVVPTDAQRQALEAALSPEDRALLDRACRLLRVPRKQWSSVDPLRRLLVALAVQQRAESHRDGPDAESWSAALARACSEFDTNMESHARQLRRWQAAARGDAADTSSGHIATRRLKCAGRP